MSSMKNIDKLYEENDGKNKIEKGKRDENLDKKSER